MDFTSHNSPTPTTHPHKHHPKPSNSELLSSAKLVAEAAKSTLSHHSDKVDKAKVAGATADLLNVASTYGKLDEKVGPGKYLAKAEDYLHHYNSSHSTTTTTTTTNSSGHSATHTTTSTITHASSHSGDQQHSGTGYGDYMKMAQGFFKNH